tara:strand:+ start:3974 stop:4702 length:729 start_codon:yes stop_codon:yes gene_type:complete
MLCLSAYATPPAYMVEVSEEELNQSLLVARENGRQEGNLNAGYHCDPLELSLLHPVWKETNWDKVETRPSPLPGEKRITFSDKAQSQITGVQECVEEDTDFVERGERALCKVVKIIDTTINSSDTIIPILVGIKDKSILAKMDETLGDIISTLESGKAYRVPDSSSLRISPGIHALNLISKAYTIFQYFAGFPPKKLSPHILSNAIEVARNQPGGAPEIQKADKPKLARQASRRIYCSHPGQ